MDTFRAVQMHVSLYKDIQFSVQLVFPIMEVHSVVGKSLLYSREIRKAMQISGKRT